MARVLFAKGAVGEIVRRMQTRLGLPAADVDGWFGGQTKDAVEAFQKRESLAETGAIDVDTWNRLMAEPIPNLRERSLQLTAHFEGHDFTLAQGNFDGAGITWGIIGFTLRGGELGAIVREVDESAPELLDQAFGSLAHDLRAVLARPWPAQLAFADSISLGRQKTRLAEPWLGSFARLGQIPFVQELQLGRAERNYYAPALATAKKWRLKTELGVALAFDVHVQNGGIKPVAAAKIREALSGTPAPTEPELRVVIANAVANAAREKWREDVRARKLAIATGTGTVHGAHYALRNWGLDELPA
jgi:hypothetical protein